MTDKRIGWDFPLPRTHCGVALGNGNFGALVWGRERLCITVNRSDFWDHRHGEVVPERATYEKVKALLGHPNASEEFVWVFNDPDHPPPRWKSSRLPLGRFELVFADGVTPRRAELAPASGRLRVELSDGAALDLAMAMDEHLLAVRDPARAVARVELRTAWEWVAEEFRTRGIGEPERIDEGDLTGWVQPLPQDPAMAALGRRTGEGWIIALAQGADNRAARAAAVQAIDRCAAQGMTALFASVERWWRSYSAELPEAELPSEFFQRFFDYALYKFGAATAPGGHPAGLQGPWAEEYQMTPWNGDYHYNVNVQQVYTLAVHANHPEHLMPLFDMLQTEPYRSILRQTAQRLYHVDDGIVLTHAMDDRGRQVGGLSVGSVLDQACAGWTAQLFWLYYQYTGDVAFLRERAYPFLRGALRAYEGMLEKRDGRYRIPVSISAEYRFTNSRGQPINYGADPSYQLACIHMLLDALFEACAILNVPPEPRWRDIREHLPPYTLIEGGGGPRIAVWEGQDLDACHRHHSHLACLYPFDTLGEMTPEKQTVLDNSLDHWVHKGMGEWSEWCFPWAAILQTRAGLSESPKTLLEIWKDVFINEGLATAYLPRFRGVTAHRRSDIVKPKETHEVMQLDGTMAGATALIEMLCFSRRGTVHLFAGIPASWPDAAFRNVGVPGAMRISATRRNGKTETITVESRAGGRIRLADSSLKALRVEGRDAPEPLPVALELKAGQTLTLRAMA